MYTIITYQYSDAGNNKQFEHIVLNGEVSAADAATITATLEAETFFIPYDLKLGITELQSRQEDFPTDEDHVWHILNLDKRETVATVPSGAAVIAVDDFVKAFVAVGHNGWDVSRAVDRLGV